jgi:hypothetical protein
MSFLGGLFQAWGADRAADASEDAARETNETNRYIYDTTRADNEPFRQAGVGAIGAQQNLLGIGAAPGAQDAAFQRWRDSTGYQFGLGESLRGIEQGAAARGGLYSGAAMKALQDRASQVANQGFNTYFGQMGALAGQGASANVNNQQAGQAYGAAFGNATTAAGNARASAYQQYGNIGSGLFNNFAYGLGRGGY